MAFISFNGKILDQQTAVVTSDNRGLRYGDGLFETMRLINGEIQLFDLHMQRFVGGIKTLQCEMPALWNTEKIREQIQQLASKNKTTKAARIRMMGFRGNGGLYDFAPQSINLVIEASPLADHYRQLNENGLVLGLYPLARKSCDIFSSLKHNNYLPYVMAALYAKEQKLNDCLLLNQHDRICDSTIANLFWVEENTVCTTPLSEGPVAGVMRSYLISQLQRIGYRFEEKTITPGELQQAEEVFLTNAAYRIRWVREFGKKKYPCVVSSKIYQQLFKQNDNLAV